MNSTKVLAILGANSNRKHIFLTKRAYLLLRGLGGHLKSGACSVRSGRSESLCRCSESDSSKSELHCYWYLIAKKYEIDGICCQGSFISTQREILGCLGARTCQEKKIWYVDFISSSFVRNTSNDRRHSYTIKCTIISYKRVHCMQLHGKLITTFFLQLLHEHSITVIQPIYFLSYF